MLFRLVFLYNVLYFAYGTILLVSTVQASQVL